jgi:hypothetical protein
VANLTITVDEATLKRARIRAIERGESVNQFLAEQLRRYAEDDEEQRYRRDLGRWFATADKYAGRGGGWKWNRDEVYDERLARYGDRS